MRLPVSVSTMAIALALPAAAWAQPPAAADPFATPPGADAADTATAAQAEVRDPLEKFNRGVWGFNQAVDRVLLKPITKAYRFVAPRPVRRGVSGVFSNLSEPWSFVNNLLQLKIGRAVNNLGRFVINTTVGLGGAAGDPASKAGYRPTPEDFGQTLARYGVKSSAYLVLPLLGPSTIRDGIGSGVAAFADPAYVCIARCTNLSFAARTGIQVARVVDVRSQLIDSGADAFLQSSLDPYATARSAYLQRRAIDLADGDSSARPGGRPINVDPATASPPPANGADDAFATPPALSGAAPAAAPDDPFATPAPEPTGDAARRAGDAAAPPAPASEGTNR